MTSRIEKVQGKNREECLQKINQEFQSYRILDEETKKVFFWVKSHVMRILIEEEKLLTNSEETKKKSLLEALNNDNPLSNYNYKSETNDDESISELKNMVEKLAENMKIGNEQGVQVRPLFIEKMETHLRNQEVDEETTSLYLEKIEREFKDTSDVKDKMVDESVRLLIENQIQIKEPFDMNQKQVIALYGPTGVGKTTTLAKIGWELHQKNKTIGFITTDTFRSAAKEQLEKYATTMGAETIVAKGVQELKEAMDYFKNVHKVDHILIDTVGRNPMLEQSLDSVKEYIEISKPTVACLVLSATSKVKDLKEIIARFEQLNINSLIFTKVDETYNVGSLLNVFNYTKIPLMYITDGQDITKNIYTPSKRMLSEKILNKTVEQKKNYA